MSKPFAGIRILDCGNFISMDDSSGGNHELAVQITLSVAGLGRRHKLRARQIGL